MPPRPPARKSARSRVHGSIHPPPLHLPSRPWLTDATGRPVCDATELAAQPTLQDGAFTKAFSNAALHWILRRPSRRAAVFAGVHAALAPGGTFAFEMGGLGNCSEILAALLAAVGRRVGVARAAEASPWFFPDEAWARAALEGTGAWRVDRVERQWRPTPADAGGVEGWIRLMAAPFFEVLPEADREGCIREVVDVLEVVCRQPDGGFMFSYVRLRVLATRL